VTVLIKDPVADKVIRELAARTGETITQAVTIAAEERLARLPAQQKDRIDRDALERTLARIRSYPVTDDRSADEIIGYDENGLPS
jgi:antitoxin VapB